MFKAILLILLVSSSHTYPTNPANTLTTEQELLHLHPLDSHPKYEFSYGVKDPFTGDEKEHTETRDGDVVHGSYSIVEPDGTRRIVEYTADAVNGFNAVVRREPQAHIQEAKVVAHAPTILAHQVPLIAHRHHPLASSASHQPVIAHHAAPLLPFAIAHDRSPVVVHHAPIIAPHHSHIVRVPEAQAITHHVTYKLSQHTPTPTLFAHVPELHASATYLH